MSKRGRRKSTGSTTEQRERESPLRPLSDIEGPPTGTTRYGFAGKSKTQSSQISIHSDIEPQVDLIITDIARREKQKINILHSLQPSGSPPSEVPPSSDVHAGSDVTYIDLPDVGPSMPPQSHVPYRWLKEPGELSIEDLLLYADEIRSLRNLGLDPWNLDIHGEGFQDFLADQGIDPNYQDQLGIRSQNPEHMNEIPVPMFESELQTRYIPNNIYYDDVGHNKNFDLFLPNSPYPYPVLTENLVSSPHGAVKLRALKFSPTEHNINLVQLPTLVSENSNGSFAAAMINDIVEEFPQGFIIGFTVSAETLFPEPKKLNTMTSYSKSMVIPPNSSPNDILAYLNEWIQFLCDRSGEGNYYKWYVDQDGSYRILYFGIYVIPLHGLAGGCIEASFLPSATLMKYLYAPQTWNNNCFFDCLFQAFPHIQQDYDIDREKAYKMIRQHFGYEENHQVYFFGGGNQNLLRPMMEYFNLNLVIYKMQKPAFNLFAKQLLPSFDYRMNIHWNVLQLYYVQKGRFGHFYLITDQKIFDLGTCGSCRKWFDSENFSMADHLKHCMRCGTCGGRMTPNHYCRGNGMERLDNWKRFKPMRQNKILDDEKWKQNVAFADLETFKGETEQQEVYSSAFYSFDHFLKYRNGEFPEILPSHTLCETFYGPNGFDKFIGFILNFKGTLWFWNGSRFDFYFILQRCVARQIPVHNLLKEDGGNRIFSVTIGRTCVLKDLMLFTLCSLKEGCKAFEVPPAYIKKDFDHKKMNSWDSIMKYKEEAIIYNAFDVICMAFIYETYALNVYNRFSHHSINNFYSLPHLSHVIWKNSFMSPVMTRTCKLPTAEVYNFVDRALFGGRCYAGADLIETKVSLTADYNRWEELDIEMKELLIDQLKSENTLKYYDCVSQYPAVSSKFKYPVGVPYWIADHLLHLDQAILDRHPDTWSEFVSQKVFRAFYEVDVLYCPQILIPFVLARRNEFTPGSGPKDELFADLLLANKVHQVYDGRTIREALILGYKFKIHRVLRYGLMENILQKYIDTVFNLKDKAAQEHGKDSVLYWLYKLFGNTFCGKHLQPPVFLDNYINYDDSFFASLNLDEAQSIKQVECLIDQKNIRGIYYQSQRPDSKVTYHKLHQVGTGILANARVTASEMYRAMGAYWIPKNSIVYVDTDSIIAPKHAFDLKEIDKHLIGSKLGQFKDEYPDEIITRFYGVAPKCYYVEKINFKKPPYERTGTLRFKGIPQNLKYMSRGCLSYTKIYEDMTLIDFVDKGIADLYKDCDTKNIWYFCMPRECCFDSVKMVKDPHWWRLQVMSFGIIYYPFIDWRMIRKVVTEDWVIKVLFGRFDKKIINPIGKSNRENNNFVVHTWNNCERTVNAKNWWGGSSKRQMVLDLNGYSKGFSVPKGHKLYQELK